jgi:DNA-binding CsgD family transcriptional regulator
MARLGRIFGANCVSLVERDLDTMVGRATAWGIDLDGQREYLDVWNRRNILVHRTRAWRVGQIETDLDLMPKRTLIDSDYYNGFMKPRDMHAIMRVTLNPGTRLDGGRNICLSLVRSVRAGDYADSERDLLRPFVPHLQRAVRIQSHLERAQMMLDGVTDLLERNTAGILLLDRNGNVVLANRAVRAMAEAEDGLTLRRERIEAIDRRDDAELQSLVVRATQRPGPVNATRAGAVRITRRSGKGAFNVVAAPLARNPSWSGEGPVAFAIVTDPNAASTPAHEILAELFGLSPTEIRVADRLAAGDTPEQLAAALNIRISTARWHLAALYRKTGTSRQAELVRLLLSLPVVHNG